MKSGSWTSCVVAILAIGCGGAGLQPGAENVEWHTERPPGDLENVGDVQCERGGNFVSPATNVSACRDAIRNQAHEMDADLVVISSEQIGSGDCANCVVFFGSAFRRRGGAPAPSVEPTPAPTVATAGGVNPSPAETEIRAGIDRRSESILECTEGQPATIVVAYGATGELSFSLTGSLAGTPAETCVRTTLGQPTIDTGGRSGAVTHEVRPGGW